MNILKSLSAYQMYRRHVGVHAGSASIISFLLKDAAFLRTIAHCLNEISGVLHDLPHSEPVLEAVNKTRQMLDKAEGEALAITGLHDFIDEIQVGLTEIHSALGLCYFRMSDSLQKTLLAAE